MDPPSEIMKDILIEFINLSADHPWTNGNNKTYFMHIPGRTMLLSEFKDKLKKYVGCEHPSIQYKWTSDYSAFEQLGYSVSKLKVCTNCQQPSNGCCCPDYNRGKMSMRHSIKDILCVEHSTSPNDDILERLTVTSASDTASIADKHINADDRMSNLEQQLNKFYTEVDRCVRTLTDRIGALEQKDIDQPTVAEPAQEAEHIVLQPAGEAKDHIKALELQHSAILDNVRALELERDILRENISDILRTIAALKDDISSLERRYRTPGIIQRYVILSAHRITSISLRIITSPVTVPMCAIVSFLYVIKRVIR